MVKQKEQKKDLKFEKRNKRFVDSMSKDPIVKKLSDKWLIACHKYEYSYHFTWLGLPIIQYPQDIIAIQEIIWKVKPDLVIETGIARGGSLLLSASILELIGHGTVLGIDVDIREFNKKNIKKSHLIKRISMIQGSSTDKKVVNQVKKFAKGKKRILIFLDSAHNFKHVLKELKSYSSLVKRGSYIVVFDTVAENFPTNWFKKNGTDRSLNKTNNPKTAVHKFLKLNNRFKIDKAFQRKLLITSAPDGFLKCVK